MTSKGIKRETTRGLSFDTRRVMSLLNDKQGENSKNEFTHSYCRADAVKPRRGMTTLIRRSA